MAASKFTTTPSPMEVVEKVNAVIDDVAGKLGSTATAAKATADASGNTITSTYETKANAITGLSVSGKTITYTKGNGTTGTITTQDTNTTYSAATTSAAGLMSAADKTKLDGIATGANKYSLPTASASTLGGIKVGSGLTISNGVLSSSGGSAAVSAYKIPYATCSTATSTAAKVATITNGVSFSLVAGAVCFVYYKYKLGTTSAWNEQTHKAWTLNISSTGAKNVTAYALSGKSTMILSSANSGTSSGDHWVSDTTITDSMAQIHLYDGTAYVVYKMYRYGDYSDYSD